jgi:hydroxyacyl-ACP dehydratase HTD2-like protein with hotdog domain
VTSAENLKSRSWIFRTELEAPATVRPHIPVSSHAKSEVRDIKSVGAGFPRRHLNWSPIALFRFSALTFNAHMIHYNESWTKNVEGHPHVVVHGPLNLINMLDYWRDIHGKDGLQAKEITYRATSPIYAGEPYNITSSVIKHSNGTSHDAPRYELLVEKAGTVCMRGEILSHTEDH